MLSNPCIQNRPRDNQRSRVYKSEKISSAWVMSDRLDTVKSIEEFVEHIYNSNFVKENWGYLNTPEIKPGKGCKCAIAYRFLMLYNFQNGQGLNWWYYMK